MARTKMRDRGQLTLPSKVRHEAHLEPGDPVEVELVAEGILLRPMKEIDSTQAWFWTASWQDGERAASADIAAGRTRVHKSTEEFLAALDEQLGRVPTHEETKQFRRDWGTLSPDEKDQFRVMVRNFVEDLESLPPRQFRPGLRVKPMRGANGIFEVTWEIHDGRTTFEYGEELNAGDPHIVWRRVGGHAIFGAP